MGVARGLHGDPERAVGENQARRPPAECRRSGAPVVGSRRTSAPPTSRLTRRRREPRRCRSGGSDREPAGLDLLAGIDAGNRAVEAVGHPDEAVAVIDGGRAAADRDRLGGGARAGSIRTSVSPAVSVTQRRRRRPRSSARPRRRRSAARPCLWRVDLRDRVVVGVRHPTAPSPKATPVGVFPTAIASTTLRLPHARDGSVFRVGHPYGSTAHRDPDPPVADLDRVDDIVALRVDPYHGAAAVRARHPDRAFSCRHALRRFDPRGLVDDRPRLGVDDPTALSCTLRAPRCRRNLRPSANTGIATADREHACDAPMTTGRR